MRRFWVCLGLLGMLACGIKGPPRPPEPKAKAEAKEAAVPSAEVKNPVEEQSLEEETLHLKEAF